MLLLSFVMHMSCFCFLLVVLSLYCVVFAMYNFYRFAVNKVAQCREWDVVKRISPIVSQHLVGAP